MRARALVTVLPDDATNVFITLTARSLNRKLMIIARGELPSTESKLIQAGANRVVLPARIGAERVAELLLYRDMATVIAKLRGGSLDRLAIDLHALGLDIEVLTVEAGSRCAGLTIGEIETLGTAGAFLVAALERQDGKTILQPEFEHSSRTATAWPWSAGRKKRESTIFSLPPPMSRKARRDRPIISGRQCVGLFRGGFAAEFGEGDDAVLLEIGADDNRFDLPPAARACAGRGRVNDCRRSGQSRHPRGRACRRRRRGSNSRKTLAQIRSGSRCARSTARAQSVVVGAVRISGSKLAQIV